MNAAFLVPACAVEDGVDAAWANGRTSSLRGDARWGKVRDTAPLFHYWASNGKPLTDLVVPMGYGREPLTTLVWLTVVSATPEWTGADWSKTFKRWSIESRSRSSV